MTPLKRTYAALAAVAVAAGMLAGTGAASADQELRPVAFDRTATYPVFQNRPAGGTLVYTDAAARRIGFLDISKPDDPRGLGTLSLTELGDVEDEPTSPWSASTSWWW